MINTIQKESFQDYDLERFHELMDAAHYYLSKGFSIVPLLPRSKSPAISSWVSFQENRPGEKDLKYLFLRAGNIAIVTGRVSGIAVIDADSEEAWQLLLKKGFTPGPVVKTQRGKHAYCKYPEGGIRNFQNRDELPGIDLRGDGGYIVAPPSIHPLGHRYEWVVGLEDIPLPELPQFIIKYYRSQYNNLNYNKMLIGNSLNFNGYKWHKFIKGVGEGSRNVVLTQLVGSWVCQGICFDECLLRANIWNRNNRPPLDNSEIERTVCSIFKIHTQRQFPLRIVESVESENQCQQEGSFPNFARLLDGF